MQTATGTGYEGDCCAHGQAVLNRLSQIFGVVSGRALLRTASKMALVLVTGVAVVLCGYEFGLAQLADSPWPMIGHDAKHTGQSSYKGPGKPELKWKFRTGGSAWSSPAIGSYGTVYVGSGGHLYAVNPDGTFNWGFRTGGVVDSSPAIGLDETIYVGSRDDYLYAVSPDGSLKWKFRTEGWVRSSPAIGSDGTIYVGSDDSYLYAVYPDGTLKWKFQTRGEVLWSSPAIGSDGTVYVGSYDDYLYAVNPNGVLKWKFQARGNACTSSPAIGADGTVYVGSKDDYLYAVSPRGYLKWKFRTESWVRSPAIGLDGTIYVGSADRYLYAVSPRGYLKWKFKTGDQVNSTPVIGSDGTVYVGSTDGYLYAHKADGTLRWKFETGGAGYSRGSRQAIGLGKTIYVRSLDGNLYALGEVFEPDIVIPGIALNFGLVEVTNSKQLTFTVLNEGVAPLLVRNITSSSPEFVAFPTSFTVAVDSSQEVTVTFTPSSAEGKWATLTIASNDPDRHIVTVSLSGNLTLANSAWPMIGHDTRHTGQSPHKGPAKPKLRWKFKTGGSVYSSPAIGSDGTVYVGSWDNCLYAINPDASLRWKFKTGGSVYSSPAIGSDGTVYVGSHDSYLYAVNPDGTLKWKFSTRRTVSSSPAIGSDGTVYVGSNDKHLYAVNPDGTLKWKSQTGGAVSSSPAIGVDGTVYVGSVDKHLHAVNPDGTLKWKFQTGRSSVGSPAIGSDGTVYVGSYAGSNDEYLYAVNPDGTLKWKSRSYFPAIGSDGTVYVGSSDSHLYALHPDGTLKWKFQTGGVTFGPVISSDGTVYVGSHDKHLYAVNPGGTLRWKFQTGGHVYSSPAIDSDGTIYVGTTDGHLYALEARSNVSPILYARRVLPETGHEQTEFVFSVTYADADNDAPSKVTVNIDDEVPKTMTRRQHDDSFVNGEVYEYRRKLNLGDHTFSFVASDGVADATGDISLHSGPTVGENTPPALSSGTVSPQTGTRGTEFRFTVIYSDLNNDASAEVTVQIDNNAAQNMTVVNPGDMDYTNGAAYEYKTKLSAGAHTYTFAAKDWSENATGDRDTHSGPSMVASGSPPVLSNGNVTPQTTRSEADFTFTVLYADPDGEPPSEIAVKIDGEAKAMVPAVAGETNYAEGVLYQYKAKLGLGSHTYSFAAKSGSRIAVGDTVSHSGPLVSTVPQEWRGATDQGRSISFTVSGDGTSVLDFQLSVETYLEITITTEEGTTTEYHNETISGTIPQMSVSNKKFSGSITESVTLETLTGTATGTARANISGAFTSPTTVEGTFSGFYPKTVIRPPASPYGWPWLQQLTLMGSGEWSASLPSSIVIRQPKDGTVLNSSSVKVSGVAEGSLVHSAEINGTPVQLTKGKFSTNVSLAEGTNVIHLIAFDADKNIVGTYSVRVTLDSTPPLVTITEPADSLETPDPRVIIKGTVDDPSILYVNVNEVPICVAEGQFSTSVFLMTGANNISVKASDEAENVGSAQITVVRTTQVGVAENPSSLLPSAFALLQNYPNPFNASTTIRYQLPQAAHVQLSIYNILGQKVRTLVEDVQPAGFYVVTWDGRNQFGADVASGLYLYCLTGGNRSFSKKMLLLR